MEGLEVLVATSTGLNIFILGSVILNSHRIGKLEGAAKNGGFSTCPFYRGHIDKEVKAWQHNGKNTK